MLPVTVPVNDAQNRVVFDVQLAVDAVIVVRGAKHDLPRAQIAADTRHPDRWSSLDEYVERMQDGQEQKDASLKYVFENELVDAITVGMMKPSEIDDTIMRMNKALNA